MRRGTVVRGTRWREIRLLVSLLCAAATAGIADAAPAARQAPPTPRLELADGTAPRGELARFLLADREWLAGWAQASPAPPDSAEAELMAWLRRAGGAGAADASPGLARDLPSLLRDRWLARGHLAADVAWGPPEPSVAGEVGDEVRAVLRLRPGPAFRLGRLAVDGAAFPARERLLALYLPRPGDRFAAAEWAAAVAGLLAAVAEAGYPFVRWLVKDVVADPVAATVDVQASLFPGEAAYLGPQSSDLPGGRGERFLIRASGLREGDRYRESALVEARRRLQARGLYAEVGEPLVHLTAVRDTVGVHWPVVPRRRANRLGVVLGYSQGRGGEAGRLSGQVDLLLPNLAGTGRSLSAAWSDDGEDLSHFGFGYLEPLAFGTPLDLEVAVDHEVARDSYSRFQVNGRARLPVVAAWGLEFGLGWDRSTFPAGAWERTGRLRARGAFLHRRLDPRRSGWEGLFAIETARRQATARTDTAAGEAAAASGSEVRQRLLEFDVEGELWLGRTLSLAGRASFREVDGDGGTIPLSEQYRFGGARSIRGYREDEFRGERILHGGLELRIGRPGRSRLYTFWDMGYFEFSAPAPTPEDAERRTQRDGTVRGFGLGLQTRTPAGDISLAIGFPGSVNFDDAKLHVSLLEAF